MRRLVMLALAACGGSSDEEPPSVPTVTTSGTVSNPVSPIQAGRLIVGVGAPGDLTDAIVCSKLLTTFDRAGVTLPVPFELAKVPARNDLVLVALLIDGSSGAQMPAASYEIDVDSSGVYFDRRRGEPLNVLLQGTMAFDCP